MKITRLSWAGLMLESGDVTLYIDPLENVSHMAPFLGEPKFPILEIPVPKTANVSVLITHIHADHFDPPVLRKLLADSGDIYAPESVRIAGAELRLTINSVNLYEPFQIGNFKVVPVPAVDWIGDEQISYIVSDGERTIIHGGDTNWHGYWWPFAKKYGPFDAAFLPVNGVVGGVPGVLPLAEMYGTMTPAQAVTAAHILGAKMLVPMHYAQFDKPPAYTEFPDLENELTKSATAHGVVVRRLADGEILQL